MNKIINQTLGTGWDEIPVPADMGVQAIAIQCRTGSDVLVNFRGGADASVYWTIKAGAMLSMSWAMHRDSTRVFVKGTAGTVVESMISTGP